MSKHSRRLPPPDLFASCPIDGRILDYYGDQFSDVFVLLHPFVKPVSLPMDRFTPGTWPSKEETVKHCLPVTWESVSSSLGFDSLANLDVALRTSIGGLKLEFANGAWSQQLSDFLHENSLLPPFEGNLPDILEDRLFSAVQALGQDWLWVGDELCTERKLVWIDDLKGESNTPMHGCFFLPDKSLLLTTHWDSHCSFLCGSRGLLENLLAFDNFEGFYCSKKTEVYWGVHET